MVTTAPSQIRRTRRRTVASAAIASALLGAGLLAAPTAGASTPEVASQVGVAVPAKAYSRATVAKHHTASDCWSIVDGKVYNLTTWIAKHPGGRKRIIRMCGKDASAAFHGQHTTAGRAGRALKRYQIGTVK